MKNILLLTILILCSFVGYTTAQRNVTATLTEKVAPVRTPPIYSPPVLESSFCCCNPVDVYATMSGQVYTNNLAAVDTVTIDVREIQNFQVVNQFTVKVNPSGSYNITMRPCYTYAIQPTIPQLLPNNHPVFSPQTMLLQNVEAGSVRNQDFTLLEILPY